MITMTELEMLIAILAPAVAIILFLLGLTFQVLQRMTKVETNVTLLLQWVACLNGNMSTEKEFKDFLKKLKKVNQENCG
jgi:cell division protein FtsX